MQKLKFEGTVKNLFKKMVCFLSFWLKFDTEGVTFSQDIEVASVLTIQGQTFKIFLQSVGKCFSIFPVLALFFHLSLPKI